jgi:hypothetical protein
LTLRSFVPLSCLAALTCWTAVAGQDRTPSGARSSTDEVAPVALRVVGAVQAELSRDGFVGWSPPTPCDSDGNVYFLLAPHTTVAQAAAAAKAGRDLPLDPREVLRVSADGKKTTVLDPSRDKNLADAKRLTTSGLAVDAQGSPFLLSRAEFERLDGQASDVRYYIVSFNDKGEPRSRTRIDEQELHPIQFEVFGGGQFLLRGFDAQGSKPRIAVLTGESALQDVVGWPVDPDEPPNPAQPLLESTQMVRGGDGRIYVTAPDRERNRTFVYAVDATGAMEEIIELRPLPRRPQLHGLLSASTRLAASYAESDSEGNDGKHWWIAVYDVANGDLQSVYGPVTAAPVCYARTGSEDRFIFLVDGSKLVTMAP